MIEEVMKFFNQINFFDIIFIVLLIYFIIQCFVKGFTLSLISFMKWVFSTIITIIFVPKAQPVVGEYIKSEYWNCNFYFYSIFNNSYWKSLGESCAMDRGRIN